MEQAIPQPNALPSLLSTNLRIPELPGELISRDILVEKLDEALNFPITLITAPAGFGKTTLLSQWIAGSNKDKLRDRVAWISLESECDLRQFWTYILTALQEIKPGVGESALALLETSQPPIQTILRILINEITTTADDFILILDDYHQVDDPTIHTALTYFVNHLPSNLHLVVGSRSQPPLSLARWRAYHQLYELREADLRFTPVEVATFFNETKGLNLSPEEITALANRTEGWIAGLQLVALSMQGFDEASKRSFVSAFTGSQRYIMDYLVEEVLVRQPDHIKTFLLRTSVLERMNASLCNVVTGQMDGQAILEHLERAQLFTIPLDQERRWYRYHHLFKDVLYHRLSQTDPDSVFKLHRRAAEWYIHAGRTDDAIRHACAAQEWDQAVELIETRIITAWNRGEIRKIISWLRRLPSEHLDSRIHLSLYYSRALMLGGQMEAADQRLRESEKALRARLIDHPDNVEDQIQLGTVCAFRTTIVAVAGETANAMRLGDEALSLLPPEYMDIRAHAINSLGGNNYHLGDMVGAIRACAEAGDLARQVGNFYLVMVSASYQAKALVCQGQLRRAGQILEQTLNLSESSSRPAQSKIPAASIAYASFGNLLYEWNRLEEAESFLLEAIELGQQLSYGSALWSAHLALARIKLAHGDWRGAASMIGQAQRYRLAYSVPLPTRLMDAEQARADLALRRLDAAERWARTCGMDRPPSPGFIQEFENIILARFYLLQDKPGQALALLDQIYPVANSNGRGGHVIEILALTALAQDALGEAQMGIDTLHTALRMAEPEGYLRTFVDEGQPMAALLYKALAQEVMPDYVRRLLAVFPADDTIFSSSLGNFKAPQARPAGDPVINERLIEPLSQRELEVLQLIANGASNQDIAKELIIATTTAKKHVSNIIQKLGVENRTQAAAKGRLLGLCN